MEKMEKVEMIEKNPGLCNRIISRPGGQSFFLEQDAVKGLVANESYKRCDLYVNGWLDLADPETGLTFCPQSPFSP